MGSLERRLRVDDFWRAPPDWAESKADAYIGERFGLESKNQISALYYRRSRVDSKFDGWRLDGSLAIAHLCLDDAVILVTDSEGHLRVDYDGIWVDTRFDLPNLYNEWMHNQKWGPYRWYCLQHQLRPREFLVDELKQLGVWADEFDAFDDVHQIY